MRDNRKSDNRETIKWDPFARIYIYIYIETNRTLNSWYRPPRGDTSKSILDSRERRTSGGEATYIYIIRISRFLARKYLPGDINLSGITRAGGEEKYDETRLA